MDLPTFVRLFERRAGQIMWFLGAGASSAAGIKTAADMIWEFKQKLYCSEKRLSPGAVIDLGDPAVRLKLQKHLDATGRHPVAGAETEYSHYFLATYPASRDRRDYIEAMVSGARPSFGHRALAALMKEGLCRVVWTTNFDRLVEDAAAVAFGTTGRLVVADLGEPAKLRNAFAAQRWPILGKLHGDFQSERLKNTQEELQGQDAEMRAALVSACLTGGLAVVGYSGRDASVMAALDEALHGGQGFPGGLFWFTRSDGPLFSAVHDLIAKAAALGIEAHIVEAETFDELFSDLIRFIPRLSETLPDWAGSDRPRRRASTLLRSSERFPAVQMNALPIIGMPGMCRLVGCEIGSTVEVREAIAAAGADVVAYRCPTGVIAFGSDREIRRAFESHDIRLFDAHPIAPKRLSRETAERSLLRDALMRALRNRPGIAVRRRRRDHLLVADASAVEARTFCRLAERSVDRVGGVVPGTAIRWNEVCEVRLDWRLEKLWLLLKPGVATWTEAAPSAEPHPREHVDLAREFVRARLAARHNRVAASILSGWVDLIVGADADDIRLRAFTIADGMDAEFVISRTLAISGRARK